MRSNMPQARMTGPGWGRMEEEMVGVYDGAVRSRHAGGSQRARTILRVVERVAPSGLVTVMRQK
jgi:hypothetical protein